MAEWKVLPTLPSESRLPHCPPVRVARLIIIVNTSGWLIAIGIYFLISLKDSCPKSSCQQGLLPLKALEKYSSLPLPGGSWQGWCSFPCSCIVPTSVQSLRALWPCVFGPFPLLRWTAVIEFRTHLIQHDIFLIHLERPYFQVRSHSVFLGTHFWRQTLFT